MMSEVEALELRLGLEAQPREIDRSEAAGLDLIGLQDTVALPEHVQRDVVDDDHLAGHRRERRNHSPVRQLGGREKLGFPGKLS